jgi:hypothetical protein
LLAKSLRLNMSDTPVPVTHVGLPRLTYIATTW